MSKTKLTLIEVESLVKDSQKKHESLEKEMADNTKSVVSLLKTIISQCPEIEGIRWTQYTPYFNDGDECTFGVNDLEYKFNEDLLPNIAESGYESSDGFVTEVDVEEYFAKQREVINFEDVDAKQKKLDHALELISTVESALGSMHEPLKQAFGDHTQVTVTKKGIETEEYDHD